MSIEQLTRKVTSRWLVAVVMQWIVIVICIATAIISNHWLVYLIAIFIVGTRRDVQGLYQLTNRSPRMREEIRRYFRERNEDSIDV